VSGGNELAIVRFASIAVFGVAAWSTWTRRMTFGSRFDAGITAAAALFGAGAVLDAPWPVCATASFPLTGRYYGLMVLGHLCYLAGATTSVASIFARLLPDADFRSFMRTRIIPLASSAAVIMAGAFLTSSLPRAYTVPHLYLATPDAALSVYWYATFGSSAVLGGMVIYGLLLLRDDPRSVMATLMLGSAIVASAGCALVVGWGLVTGRIVVLQYLAWFGGYLGFAGFALAAAVQWQHREKMMRLPPGGMSP
jgi:hypothetical protein